MIRIAAYSLLGCLVLVNGFCFSQTNTPTNTASQGNTKIVCQLHPEGIIPSGANLALPVSVEIKNTPSVEVAFASPAGLAGSSMFAQATNTVKVVSALHPEGVNPVDKEQKNPVVSDAKPSSETMQGTALKSPNPVKVVCALHPEGIIPEGKNLAQVCVR